LDDASEILVWGTDPLDPDSDGDGMTDGDETSIGLNPNDWIDVPLLTDNDSGAPHAPPASVIYLKVEGTNDPEASPPQAPESDSEIGDLEADVPYLALVAVESDEFPSYTGISSEWNDTVSWTISVDGNPLDQGNIQVNDRHGDWLQAIVRGSELFGLRPVHYEYLGIVKPKTITRTGQLIGTVGNVADGDLPTTLVMAFIPLKIVPDQGMEGVLGDLIDSNKRATDPEFERHFVSPKKSAYLGGDYVNLKAEVPTEELFNQLLRWSPASAGEAVAGEPLKWRVPRDAPAKHVVKLETNPAKTGHSAADADLLNTWIVWANGVPRRTGSPRFVPDTAGWKTIDGRDTEVSFWQPINDEPADWWQFVFQIQPLEIVENYATEDLPDLIGGVLGTPEVPGKGSNHPVFGPGTDLGNGATHRWDVSRQMQVHMRNPQGIPKIDFPGTYPSPYSGQPQADSIPIFFPSDSLVGNDDAGASDENNNPYAQYSDPAKPALHHNVGFITSTDAPSIWMSDIAADQGRTFEETDSFREFARLQLPSKWFRISEDVEWSTTLKIKYSVSSTPQNPNWDNDGSTSTP
jgi:hypothetical protein